MMRFDSEYNESDFISFVRRFLPDDLVIDKEKLAAGGEFVQLKGIELLGRSESLGMAVYHAEHNSENDPRVGVSRDIFRVMSYYGERRALAAFTSREDGRWRLSLVTIDVDITEKGKVKRKYSNPRRYSYLLGPGAKVHTPQTQLIGKISDFNDLRNRFSLEVVNKEFYAGIAMLFTKLTGGKRKSGNREITSEGLLEYPQGDEQKGKNFAVRLLGRLVFCWFLKKKTLISDDVLCKERLEPLFARGADFYHGTLEPLFFEVLNTKIPDRRQEFKTAPWSDVPFLNGGLFTPHSDDFYSGEPFFELKIPDQWFAELFELFETYNFTVDESTSVDVELAIDPEMLGRIFENLLAEINPETGQSARKSTGSYYTPRQIVDYMVDTSLKNYLYTNTDIDRDKIESLFDYDMQEQELELSQRGKIVDVLHKIKVLDPACGSGAYPMGVLQRMLFVLQRVDKDSKLWFEKAFETKNELLKNEIRKKINTDYIHKLGIIQNSIYGVDIQPIAVEMSKLRVFLSLIVDEDVDECKANRGVETLPNLEFKFVCANTLVKLPKSHAARHSLFDEDMDKIDKLKKISERYFTTAGEDKNKIIGEFEAVQREMFSECIEDKRHNANNRTNMLVSWKPFKDEACGWFDPEWMFGVKTGFDIVIGNPPYFNISTRSNDEKEEFRQQDYKTFEKSADIYCLFYERGFELLAEGGHLCYISSNKWMRAGYGEKLRKFLSSVYQQRHIHYMPTVKVLVDFGGHKVFESATVDTNILVVEKKKSEGHKQRRAGFCAAACRAGKDFTSSTDIEGYVGQKGFALEGLNKESWIIGTPEEMSLRKKIESRGVPLKDWDISIYRGVLTGYNPAFIIDGAKKDELIAADPKNAEIIKPILRGRDIKKYKAEFADKWLINTHNGIKAEELPRIDVENDYPVIYEYLKQFQKQLEKRQDKGDHWTNLRNCAYYSEFEKEKIVYTDISRCLTFTLDNEGMLMNNTCYFLDLRQPNKYVLTILNSKLLDWYYRGVSAQLGAKGIRHFSIYIELLPIPQLSESEQQPFVDIVDKIISGKSSGEDTSGYERRVDEMVYELYGLSDEEIRIVEERR